MNNSEDAYCRMDYSYCVIVKLEFVNLITAASFEKLAMVNFGSEHMVICVIISMVVLSLFPVLQIQSKCSPNTVSSDCVLILSNDTHSIQYTG